MQMTQADFGVMLILFFIVLAFTLYNWLGRILTEKRKTARYALVATRDDLTEETGERKFPLGQVVSTPGALDSLARADQDAWQFLGRHVAGDWGEIDEDDHDENELAVKKGFRIFSGYTLSDGTRIWIITEADRSSTTILLPEEY